MKSTECMKVIMDDLENNRDDLWDFIYNQKKGDTTAEISHMEPVTDVKDTGNIVMVMQGRRPVYDESTRKLRWNSMSQLKQEFIDEWAKDKKPWTRCWRKKRDGAIARMFDIVGGPLFFYFLIVCYEDSGKLTRIEYWHNRSNDFYEGKWFPPGPAMFVTVI